MICTVIGKQRKVGNYEGYDYDNTTIYATIEGEKVEGLKCGEFKFKTAKLPDSIGIGDTIEVYYNQYNKPETAVIVQKGVAK